MVLLAAYRVECDEFSRILEKEESIPSLPDAPDISRVKGDWTVLDGGLQQRIRGLDFERTQHEARLADAFDEFGGGDEYRSDGVDLYQERVRKCDAIIRELSTLCDLPSPRPLDE